MTQQPRPTPARRRRRWVLLPVDVTRLCLAVTLTAPTLIFMRALGVAGSLLSGRTGPALRRVLPRRVGRIVGALGPLYVLGYGPVQTAGVGAVVVWTAVGLVLVEASAMALRREAWIAAFEPQWLDAAARPLGGRPRRTADRRLQHLLRVHAMFGLPLVVAGAAVPVELTPQAVLTGLFLLRYASFAGDDFEAFVHWDMHCDVLDVGNRPLTRFWRTLMEGFLGPLSGYVPLVYRTEHLLIHHWRNSGPEDINSTTPYRRTSFVEFCLFSLSVLGSTMFATNLAFHRRCRGGRRARLLLAVGGFWLVTGLLLTQGRLLGGYLVVLAMVHGVSLARFQYVWHGLIPPDDPARLVTSTVLWVAGPEEWRSIRGPTPRPPGSGDVARDGPVPAPGTDWGFYDNHHLLHHLRPRAYFTEYPELLGRLVPELVQAQSVVLDLRCMRSFVTDCWSDDVEAIVPFLLTDLPERQKVAFLRARLEPVPDNRHPLAYLCEAPAVRAVDAALTRAIRRVA